MMFKIDIDSAVQYSLKYQIVVQSIMHHTKQYINVITAILCCLNSTFKSILTFTALGTLSLFQTLNIVCM